MASNSNINATCVTPPTTLSTTTTTTTILLHLNNNSSSISEENETAILIISSSPKFSKLISDQVLYWSETIGYIGICGTLSILGIVANIINIIVFMRQGVLADSNTFSLMMLSISDLFSLVPLLWVSICFLLVYVRPPGLPFDPMDMLMITGGCLHLVFVQTTSWITAYVAFERCMCVIFPFKVRTIFTAKRTAIVLPSLVFIIIFGGYTPYYVDEYLVWETVPGTNRSILVLYQRNVATVDTSAILNAMVAKPASCVCVLCFTQITVIRVNISRKWRKLTSLLGSAKSKTDVESKTKSHLDLNDMKKEGNTIISKSSGTNTNDKKRNTGIGSREKRLVKMIWVICVVFIACTTPNVAFIVVEIVVDGMAPGEQYNNMFSFMYVFCGILEAVNSTINILVYYHMSTRYRVEFRKLFDMEQEAK